MCSAPFQAALRNSGLQAALLYLPMMNAAQLENSDAVILPVRVCGLGRI
jgi:hypothetical protein